MYEYSFKINKILQTNLFKVIIDLGFNTYRQEIIKLMDVPHRTRVENERLYEFEHIHLQEILKNTNQMTLITHKKENDIWVATVFLDDGTILNHRLKKYYNIIKNYR